MPSFKQMGTDTDTDTDTDAADLFPHMIKLCPVYQAPLQIHTHPYTNTYIHVHTLTHPPTHTKRKRTREREREREVKKERPFAMLFEAACHLPLSPMHRERGGGDGEERRERKTQKIHTHNVNGMAD